MSGLQVVLAPDLGEIGRLAELVEAFGEEHDLPMKVVFNFNLAFDELITNTISYGFDADAPPPPERRIEVTMRMADGAVVAEISDNGRAFDPFAEAPAPDLDAGVDDRAIGGLGVHLVKTLIGEVGYRRDGEMNRISLRQPV